MTGRPCRWRKSLAQVPTAQNHTQTVPPANVTGSRANRQQKPYRLPRAKSDPPPLLKTEFPENFATGRLVCPHGLHAGTVISSARITADTVKLSRELAANSAIGMNSRRNRETSTGGNLLARNLLSN